MLKSPYCIVISPFKFLEGEIENSKFEIVIEDVTSVILINELSLDVDAKKTKTTQDTTTFFKLTITRANDTPPRK
jgi:hypothetical protein